MLSRHKLKHTGDRENSLNVLRQALRQMRQHPAGFHPLAYAVWYEHEAGINPGLTEALQARFAERTPITDEEVLWLHSTYIGSPRVVAAERLATMLTSVLHDIVCAARRTDTDVSHFIAVLDERRRQLTEPQEQGVLEAIAAGLIGDTQQMHRIAAEFADRFESNAKEVASLQARLKEAESDAFVDPLTGLSNRRGFDRETRPFRESTASLAGSALLFVDIDHFKAVNDKYGHVLGDKVLRAVASVIRASIKGRDIAARFGGEEFVVLLPDTTLDGARSLAAQIRSALGKGRVRDARGTSIGQVTVSIGIARAKSIDSIESLLERADAALYAAKRAGRDQVVCATSAA